MDWSYIAGFFDGEGNFHIVFTKKSIQIICRIYGNSVEAFNEMIEFMGFGKIYYDKRDIRVPELTITKKEYVKAFLEGIIPYLIVKRDHAKFIFSEYHFERHNNLDFNREFFYSFVKRKGAHKFRNQNRTKEIEELRKQLSRSPNNY